MEVRLACWGNVTCHQRRTEMRLAADDGEERAAPSRGDTAAAASPAEEVESKSGERRTA